MSQPLFHASLAFAISAILLRLDGVASTLAFVPALSSVLIDLDATLSPSGRHETALHSAAFVSLTLIAIPPMLILSIPVSVCLMPVIASGTHLAQDILQGERLHQGLLTRLIDIDRRHRPDIGRALDLASLPLALFAALL